MQIALLFISVRRRLRMKLHFILCTVIDKARVRQYLLSVCVITQYKLQYKDNSINCITLRVEQRE